MTSTSPSQQRTANGSTAASTPTVKPPCKIHPTATVADKAILTGAHEIEIGEHSVVHPYAKIRAEGGRVTIGAYCSISEAAVVGVSAEQTGEVSIGDHVLIDSGARVDSATIGNSTEIGIQAIIESGAAIGKHCKVAPKWTVKSGQILDDYTVVYGEDLIRKDVSAATNSTSRDARVKIQEKIIGVLQERILNGAAKYNSL